MGKGSWVTEGRERLEEGTRQAEAVVVARGVDGRVRGEWERSSERKC